jgi:hypothetical protein
MALKTCRECGTRVSTKAAACPSCGAPVKKAKTISTGLGFLIMLVALIVFVTLSSSRSSLVRPERESHFSGTASSGVEARQPGADNGSAIPSATILSSALVDFVDDKGNKTQKVVVRWKNSGMTPIRAIDAEITHWDASGELLGKYNYTIFATFDDEPGVAPGEINTTRGFILPGFKVSKSVEVSVTKVLEHSGM